MKPQLWSLPTLIALSAGLAFVGPRASGQDAPKAEPRGPHRVVVRTVLLRRPEARPMAVGDRLGKDVVAAPIAPAGSGPSPLLAGKAPGPIVLFCWSARCPVTRRYDEALAALVRDFGGRIRFALLCPNDDEDDAALTQAAERAGLDVPVLRDHGQAAADRLGAWVTPTALVFDGDGVLRYRGPVDDDRAAKSRVNEQHLRRALQAILAGKDVENAEPRAFGSSVRRPGS